MYAFLLVNVVKFELGMLKDLCKGLVCLQNSNISGFGLPAVRWEWSRIFCLTRVVGFRRESLVRISIASAHGIMQSVSVIKSDGESAVSVEPIFL